VASTIVLSLAVLTACALGLGAPQGPAIGENDHALQTPYDFAMAYIEYLTQGLNVAEFDEPDGELVNVRPANIIDTTISRFEMVGEFDHLLPDMIELWLLDFIVQTDDLETEILRWGTFHPDSEGWIGHHTSWNDANVFLAFTRENYNYTFLGIVPRDIQMHDIGGFWEENPERLEYGVRAFLERTGGIPVGQDNGVVLGEFVGRTAIVLRDTPLLNPYVITVDVDENEVILPIVAPPEHETILLQNDMVVVLPDDENGDYYKVQMSFGDPPRFRGHVAKSDVSFDPSLFVNANQCILVDAIGFDADGNEVGIFNISGVILERRDGMILVTIPSSNDSVWFNEADARFDFGF
jgi:hypothetical protein